jgi:hypothetical protein
VSRAQQEISMAFTATRPLALAGALIGGLGLAGSALAHHGWSWAEAGMIELTGTISAITIAPPHPIIEVDAEGEIWTVELGNPGLTERSGFVEGVAEVGEEIIALGNRAQDGSTRMKAVRITIGEDVYDIYPDRIPAE